MDPIERQDAIDATQNADVVVLYHKDEPVDEVVEKAIFATKRSVRTSIKELPSAQPEIIRCKDCKYWMPYDWMFNKIWQSQNINDYSEDEISCKYCDMRMKADDFCSRSERREE